MLELDPEKPDDEYFLHPGMRKMKKAMTLPAFFGIYGLIWLCLALTMDYIPLVMFLIWAMIAAALGVQHLHAADLPGRDAPYQSATGSTPF